MRCTISWSLLATVHCLRDEDEIGWSKFLLEFALEFPCAYSSPPLLRGRLQLVREEIQLQRKSLTLEHVSSDIEETEKNERYKCYKRYKASDFLWKNELARSLFWHETNIYWVFLSKVWISEVYLEPRQISLMELSCKNS